LRLTSRLHKKKMGQNNIRAVVLVHTADKCSKCMSSLGTVSATGWIGETHI
jgi:hypothetical protein